MRDKYGTEHDKYCYNDSNVLINRLNIRDPDRLAEAETAFTMQRYIAYRSNVVELQQLNFSHLKFLHGYLFQDLFDWAGQIREIDISKGNTRFCTVSRIEPEVKKLFDTIPHLTNVSLPDLVPELANLFCEFNLLHPS
ncbi:MAG: Fic/DOC family protein [Vibrio litoralis]|uniref:Fic/DOC family protein n=1 Tax=Vibrio litoralis TaxID=335972 RepID=UPI003F968C6E